MNVIVTVEIFIGQEWVEQERYEADPIEAFSRNTLLLKDAIVRKLNIRITIGPKLI